MKCLLYIRPSPDTFSAASSHPNYLSALTEGQRLAFGQFYIDTGNRIPTRDTQLGLTPDTYIKQKKTMTDRGVKESKLIQED